MTNAEKIAKAALTIYVQKLLTKEAQLPPPSVEFMANQYGMQDAKETLPQMEQPQDLASVPELNKMDNDLGTGQPPKPPVMQAQGMQVLKDLLGRYIR